MIKIRTINGHFYKVNSDFDEINDELKCRNLNGMSISINGERDISTKKRRFVIPFSAIESIEEVNDEKSN
ncbi:hypothetical protein H5S40_03095 [Limosilactobacillus sp. RRLNB_1_1]|uniref:Uncharacterized protein n=1 Tax=Limosilactobacillus albertensis TaxID=2759752 RepID=A0A7W3Y7M5_9LACO|nr:hypothetical protein [Limosilactobacillus albertensis]MBB1069145.1 hypothetical protein [Limosilactobacillus albertensis]MCD7117458.1 hypothetical protein [Limosilactobacillus albertensis]MCD7127930.1 hypothetical protein [Limosilactobacillus albertensis]